MIALCINPWIDNSEKKSFKFNENLMTSIFDDYIMYAVILKTMNFEGNALSF
jgi:hypothetical protein